MVKIVNLGSGEERNLVTDGKGDYAVGFLPPGQYRIEISQAGFKTVVREPVTVRVTEWAGADALLDVAQQRESVTVTSEAEILQTGTTALGRVVDSQLITELPLVTRNFTQLTALSPGSSISLPDSSALGNGSQNVYTNGAYQLSNSYLINGIDATNVAVQRGHELSEITRELRSPPSTAFRSSSPRRRSTMRLSDATAGPTSVS